VRRDRCEGCKVCVHFCPAKAIAFTPRHCGRWHISQTRFGPLVHAQLFPGQENSGRLVALLRQEAKALAKSQGRELILCDGTPGIGCPVISSLSGVDLAVVVTEPTPSGLHDLERVVELCGHFRTSTAAIINKHDLNEDLCQDIARFCAGKGMPVLARLPHDPAMVMAMVAGQTVTEYHDSVLTAGIRQAWEAIQGLAAKRRAA
jgi:MinD superfamily P-loop ATPase